MKSNALYLFFKKPIVAGVTTFIILLSIAQYIAYQKYYINKSEQQKEINTRVKLINEKLQALVINSYSATKTLAYLVEKNGIPEDFNNIARDFLKKQEYFDVVQLVDGDGFITHVYPLEGNDVIGFNIITSNTARSGALATIERKDFFIAGPVNLKQGGVGIISRHPIYDANEDFNGFSAVITTMTNFFQDLNIDTFGDNKYVYQLSRVNTETGEEAFFLENDMTNLQEFAVPIEMSYGEWKLYVVPARTVINSALWYSIFGLVLAVIFARGMWYFAGQAERINKLITLKLNQQEIELNTVYKSTKAKIEESKANLTKAQQISKLGSWEINLATNKFSWSNEMFNIYEKNPKSFKPFIDAHLSDVHPEDLDLVKQAYKDLKEKNKPYQIVYRLNLGDGRIKYLEEQCEVVNDESNRPIKVICTTQDITERKEIEQVLKNSELLYRSLTSNAPVAIFTTNDAGECNYVNEEWIKYAGISFDEAMGFGWANAIHIEDRARVLLEWQKAIASDEEFKTEFRFQDSKGKITYLDAKAIKLIDNDNNSLGYIGIAVDITERVNNENEMLKYRDNLEQKVELRTKELNDSKEALLNLLEDINAQSEELKKEKVKAQSADLMKSAFLATMSHELRTPMNSIIGFTGILLKELAGPLNEEQKKQLNMVKNSGAHLLGLINDILDISKIEAGKLKVSFFPFNYLETLEKTIDFLKPQAKAKGLKIHTELSELDITLNSDIRRVEQVLLNLLSNAIKFSTDGIITVKVSVEDDYLITEVIDQGIGISKDDIVKLFMPFIQLEAGLNRNHDGTGLGLAISKSLIEKLGGTIQVESEKGKGSNFIFKLPLEHLDNN